MDRVKRAERLAVMSRVLTANPNKIYTLSTFSDLRYVNYQGINNGRGAWRAASGFRGGI